MHKLAQLCVNRPVFATMLVMSLVVLGLIPAGQRIPTGTRRELSYIFGR